MAENAKLLLKARPTSRQLADRLRPIDGVWPDGLELYLAAADLASQAEVDSIVGRIERSDTPPGFSWLIEGPIDSLDGADFDITRESEADRLVLERVGEIARRTSARAVNIHVIAPSPDLSRLSLDCRAALLERAVPFLRDFVELILDTGAVPTVEHMPPVLRMRRSDFAFTPIGMASADFEYLTRRIEGLRVLVDTSHAGLYLNARRLPPDAAYRWSAPLLQYLAQLPAEEEELTAFLASFPRLENAQVSNAAGVLGEGLPYAMGDFDLDPTIVWLSTHVRHIVTETIEADHENAVLMRDAVRRMRMIGV